MTNIEVNLLQNKILGSSIKLRNEHGRRSDWGEEVSSSKATPPHHVSQGHVVGKSYNDFSNEGFFVHRKAVFYVFGSVFYVCFL